MTQPTATALRGTERLRSPHGVEGTNKLYLFVVGTQLDAMYRTALRLLQDRDDAQDAVQDALHKGWRRLDQFGHDENMKAWLFRILTNTCIDRVRARKRFQDMGVMCDVNDLDIDRREAYGRCDGDLLPDEAAENNELKCLLEREIHCLAPLQRAVVQLIIVEQMSYQETASVLDVPVGTVRSRLSRARTQLCEKLAGQLDGKAVKEHAEAEPQLRLVTR